MRRIVIACCLLIASSVFAQPTDEAVKKELKSFQGKWAANYAQDFNGNEQTNAELQLISLEVDGDMFTMKTGSLTIKGSFTVDPSKKLKTIDVFLGENKETVLRGIYEIKGDTRKSCFAMPGKDRPTEFRKGKDYMIMEWRADK
ncbi:MAG TPA: TIGR03067 domain-containing protein [Gemmataceae bacterium]|nr:TIGR03067 domain-containing protein [Gemmataceae bacterium]